LKSVNNISWSEKSGLVTLYLSVRLRVSSKANPVTVAVLPSVASAVTSGLSSTLLLATETILLSDSLYTVSFRLTVTLGVLVVVTFSNNWVSATVVNAGIIAIRIKPKAITAADALLFS